MDETQREVDEIRKERSEVENHIIDEYAAGRLSRRDFVRRGTVIGMSIPMVAFLAAACGGGGDESGGGGETTAPADTGGADTGAPAETAPPTTGGTFRLGSTTPAGTLNPVTILDQGGLVMNALTGQFLTLSLGEAEVQPQLAESWTPNEDLTEWTFTIRQGVTFNDEAATPMTAKDVAYTFNLHADPANKGNALSALGGVLTPGNAVASDDTTVVFTLDAPNYGFPNIVSSDNYNLIILPENYDPADWDNTFIGTGPFTRVSYTPKVGASLARNPTYWGPAAPLDAVEVTFYEDEQAHVLALVGKQIDAIDQFGAVGGQAILADPESFTVLKAVGTPHRQLSMRNDMKPFDDKRVRQAIALTLDRPAIIETLWKGLADLGNDSPMAPFYPQTDTSVPQRAQDLEQAKQLLTDAGYPNGFKTQMNVAKTVEVPQYAQLVQAAAKQIGVEINLVVQDLTTYYGDGVFGSSPWLDSIMSLVDYAHRSVPNTLLAAPLLSDGTWNAAHFKNPEYDALVPQFIGTADLQTQQQIAGEMQTLLLDETPIIFAFFYNFLSAIGSNASGVVNTAVGQIFLDQASISA